MEFEDWDSLMESSSSLVYDDLLSNSDGNFTESNAQTGGGGGSPAPMMMARSLVAGVGTVLLSSMVKAAIPAGVVLFAYRNYREATSLCAFRGSCHCQSVRFAFQARRRLKIETSREQSRYNDVLHRYTKVNASNFEIIEGKDQLNTYRVDAATATATDASSSASSAVSLGTTRPGASSTASSSGHHRCGARAFCRRCGVHILHVPNKTSKYMKVNVTCISPPMMEESACSTDDDTAPSKFLLLASKVEIAVCSSIAWMMARTATHWLVQWRRGQRTLHRTEAGVVGGGFESTNPVYRPVVQSMLGVGNAILEKFLHPYALFVGSS